MSEINFDTSAELLITCKKGDSFVWDLTDVQIDGVDIDATYSAVMKVRSSEGGGGGAGTTGGRGGNGGDGIVLISCI